MLLIVFHPISRSTNPLLGTKHLEWNMNDIETERSCLGGTYQPQGERQNSSGVKFWIAPEFCPISIFHRYVTLSRLGESKEIWSICDDVQMQHDIHSASGGTHNAWPTSCYSCEHLSFGWRRKRFWWYLLKLSTKVSNTKIKSHFCCWSGGGR